MVNKTAGKLAESSDQLLGALINEILSLSFITPYSAL